MSTLAGKSIANLSFSEKDVESERQPEPGQRRLR
jgi:hypothetical protein